jgi:hypothetical protein
MTKPAPRACVLQDVVGYSCLSQPLCKLPFVELLGKDELHLLLIPNATTAGAEREPLPTFMSRPKYASLQDL